MLPGHRQLKAEINKGLRTLQEIDPYREQEPRSTTGLLKKIINKGQRRGFLGGLVAAVICHVLKPYYQGVKHSISLHSMEKVITMAESGHLLCRREQQTATAGPAGRGVQRGSRIPRRGEEASRGRNIESGVTSFWCQAPDNLVPTGARHQSLPLFFIFAWQS